MAIASEKEKPTPMSTYRGRQESIMKSLTVRRLVTIVGALVVLRILWSMMGTSQPTMDTDLNTAELVPDFKPKSCVVVNGKCVSSPEEPVAPPVFGKGLYTYNDKFYLDDQPFRILSGSLHYFRIQPAQWRDRLLRMKAAGLNTVTTYVAWNLHEKIRQDYRFSGRYDIAAFIKQCDEAGLKVIIRAGPYICAEWEFGGFPSWLLHDKDMVFRSSSYKPFMRYIEDYLLKLLPIVAKYTHKREGPIIAFQIENEFGSQSQRDDDYMNFLLDLHKKSGIEELMLTSDNSESLQYGAMPGVLTTINFANKVEDNLDRLKAFQPNKPLMVMEFWSGWFDHWGEKHHSYTALDLQERLEVILRYNGSVNFYMFTGSTNFGFYNGANNGSVYAPTVTSYDYDAPISECGDITDKFKAVRESLIKYKLTPQPLPEIPPNPRKMAYGNVKMKYYATYQSVVPVVETLHGGRKIVLNSPVTMEMLDINNNGGQGYGYILYRCLFNRGKTITIHGTVQDRAQILINGKEVALIEYNKPTADIDLTRVKLNETDNQLDILVENMGRVNYRSESDMPDIFAQQRKGIKGRIELDGRELTQFQHIPFEFSQAFRQKLAESSTIWKNVQNLKKLSEIPTVYRGSFEIEAELSDTFLDTTNWTRGVVFINGFNIGRYWNRGPQRTLYVPYPVLLLGTNEVLIFELHRPSMFVEIALVDKPQLG